jgi:hypothetical protein
MVDLRHEESVSTCFIHWFKSKSVGLGHPEGE